jgi:hypothetical protein
MSGALSPTSCRRKSKTIHRRARAHRDTRSLRGIGDETLLAGIGGIPTTIRRARTLPERPSPQRQIVMTSQGSAYGRFQRAIRRRQLFHAELAARELGHLSLSDALALALLIAEAEPQRWPRAAARWHARFVLEAQGIGLDESALAFAAVAALAGKHRALAAQTLQQLARSRGLASIEDAIERARLETRPSPDLAD